MYPDEAGEFIEQFNRQGGPIPAVDPRALGQVWRAMQRAEADASSQTKTMGLGALAGYGVDISALGAGSAHHMALTLRLSLLSSLSHRGVLHEYLLEGKLNEVAFQSAATIPLDKEELGEALLLFQLAQSPEEAAARAKDQLRAEGYDPEKPAIDSKFLAWLRAHS